MNIRNKFYLVLRTTLLMGLISILVAIFAIAAVKWYFIPQLPSVERLKEIRLQVPLHIYTKDKAFIAEYGEQRRTPLTERQIPPLLTKAILAAEDDRFFEHGGVDLKGLLRAVVSLLKTGEKRQGGSTITMQVARNFFLTHKRTFTRKFNEILLAFKIEEELTKDEILKLYLNKIFLGNHAYGVGAAAQVYYGTDIDKLSLAQLAMIASLPKAPSANNPISNPKRALKRRNYILTRMQILGYIGNEEYETAIVAPITAKIYKLIPKIDGLYVAEMVRSYLIERFGEQVSHSGYRVFTTIDSSLQQKANLAVRKNLLRYDRRHGYTGAIANVPIPKKADGIDLEKWAAKALQKYPVLGNLIPSIVLKVNRKSIVAFNSKVGKFTIKWSGLSWARRYITSYRRGRYPKNARAIVKLGDIIMATPSKIKHNINKLDETSKEQPLIEVNIQNLKFKDVSWRLSQIPQVEGALVTISPNDGSIMALAGGFHYFNSKFNRVTQAKRQPGSTFKPFIYSAALSRGFSANYSVNDAPIVYKIGGGKRWRPRNYSKRYYGWTTIKRALAYSHNVSSVRLLEKVGVDYAINHLTNFGFNKKNMPKNLTIALGTGEVTPLKLATGYAVFANGGFRVKPYFIDRIEDSYGKVIYSSNPLKICRKCPAEVLTSELDEAKEILTSHTNCDQMPRYAPKAITSYNAYSMTSMLKDVIRIGTAKRARRLKRRDMAGKTGTTSNLRDAWFVGYNSDIVTAVWVGFDKPRSLGYKETGGRTALPMWMDFMSLALRGKPIKDVPEKYQYSDKKIRKKTAKKSKKRKKKKRTVKKSTVIPEQLF
ncbi:PBP1A family penicillin-binding protein [Candidatus Halobeggiatoa sp. HSG11]|nr:PBP1A family penicillin-binding protein [Candidatus Halobeggiatoa sp. HSG11]